MRLRVFQYMETLERKSDVHTLGNFSLDLHDGQRCRIRDRRSDSAVHPFAFGKCHCLASNGGGRVFHPLRAACMVHRTAYAKPRPQDDAIAAGKHAGRFFATVTRSVRNVPRSASKLFSSEFRNPPGKLGGFLLVHAQPSPLRGPKAGAHLTFIAPAFASDCFKEPSTCSGRGWETGCVVLPLII